MSHSVIADAVAKYVTANPENLELALEIEKALPIARERIIRNVLDAIKSCVEESIGEGQWEVTVTPDKLMTTDAFIGVRKNDWPTSDSCVTGVWICPDTKGYKDVYIAIRCPGRKNFDFPKILEICREHMTEPKTHTNLPAWEYLEGDFKDWQSRDFLLRATDKKEGAEIAENLGKRLIDLAKAIEPVFG